MFALPVSWREDLTPEQREVAKHGESPLVVMAGAGTGKTRALVARVAALLEAGVPPGRILLLTFTRRAADDMVARAIALSGGTGADRPHGGTFHAVAHRHVAAHAEQLGLPTGFSLLDPSSAVDLMDLLRAEHGMVGTRTRFPRPTTLLEIYSRAVNHQRPLRQIVPTAYPWCEPHLEPMSELFRHFTERKRQGAVLDFDDLLLYWRALLQAPSVGPSLAGRYSHVLVDEYQDVNPLQVDLVRLLAPAGRGLTVVGDEGQAIYGFRGSEPDDLRKLVASYPEARAIRLDRNFRSSQQILDLANRLRPDQGGDGHIELLADRPGGNRPTLLRCYDAASEARAVVERVLSAYEAGTALREQAVLVRAGHHSDLIELELSVRHVPYRKYGGLRFLEAAHVKDLLAALRLVEHGHDEVAWYRLLRLHRHVGPTRARELTQLVRPAEDDALARWPDLVAAAPPACRGPLSTTFARLMEAREQETPGARVELAVAALRPVIEARYDDARVRLGDLERLVAAAGGATDFGTWLAELTLDPPISTGDLAHEPELDEDYLVISTIHSAKGLEWSVVHLPQLVDGFMPIDMAMGEPGGLEEEHRLFYVAVTRARDELHLSAPLRMPHRRFGRDDRHSYAPITRFLDGPVLGLLSVSEEARPETAVIPLGEDRPVVDLDPLWA